MQKQQIGMQRVMQIKCDKKLGGGGGGREGGGGVLLPSLAKLSIHIHGTYLPLADAESPKKLFFMLLTFAEVLRYHIPAHRDSDS